VNEQPVVLVVEDEPLLRMSAVDMVEDAGFVSATAANAAEAIKILETRLDIRIVFSDIDMPLGIDGMKLAAIIRSRWPPIEIILVSGYFDPGAVSLSPRAEFFPKPYRETDVVAVMKRFAAHFEST
jgi:CheY-like chemotaxis protein